MVRSLFVFSVLLAFIGFAISRCEAATYTVGDTSGWDISTDVDSWAQDKHFVVGDVLLFMYSSSHSVEEVNRESYQGCNTTNVLQPSSSNGNTSFALTKPGNRYFICGNKLHCYAGMKLHVVVDGKATTDAPAAAPEAEAGGGSTSTPTTTTITATPSSKKNNPSSLVPNSAMLSSTIASKSSAFVGFIICLLAWII